jgi:MFS family permease
MNFELLRNKNFTLLVLGKLVSLIGSVLQSFALSLYVLKITGSGSIFASVVAVSIIPRLILGPVCGVFVDWFDRKKIIVALDFLSGALVLGLYVISITVGVQLVHVYIAVILMAVISSLFNPAISTAIPSIMKKEELLDANSFNTMTMTIGNLVGPMLAGIIYGIFGLPVTLLLNGISFILSAISEMFIDLPNNRCDRKNISYSKFKTDFGEGIKYILGKSTLTKLLGSAFVINFAFNPMFSVGLMFVSKMILKVGDMEYGALQTTLVAGSLIGTLLVSKVSKRFELTRIFYSGVLFCGFFVSLIGLCSATVFIDLFQSSAIPFIILAAVGLIIVTGVSIINISMLTLNQKEIPNELLGRVNSVWSTISTGAIPLGQIFFGMLYDKLPGYVPALFTSFVLISTAIYLMLSLPKEKKEECITSEADTFGTV